MVREILGRLSSLFEPTNFEVSVYSVVNTKSEVIKACVCVLK